MPGYRSRITGAYGPVSAMRGMLLVFCHAAGQAGPGGILAILIALMLVKAPVTATAAAVGPHRFMAGVSGHADCQQVIVVVAVGLSVLSKRTPRQSKYVTCSGSLLTVFT